MSRPKRPTGPRRLFYRAPISLYRAGLGGLLGSRFVLIHHVGRRSGLARQVVVEVVARDPRTGAITVASGFGPASDWYLNLKAGPDTDIELGSHRIRVRARFLPPEESAAAMVDYARRHPRAARILVQFMGFPRPDDTEGFARAGREIPMVSLEPVAVPP